MSKTPTSLLYCAYTISHKKTGGILVDLGLKLEFKGADGVFMMGTEEQVEPMTHPLRGE